MTAAEVRILEKIPKSSLICGKPLGQGGFGNVIKGTYNGKDVAVKILHSPVRAESYIEFNFMFQLKHRNLARMVGLVDVGYAECPQLVFLQASKGNLLQYVEGIGDDVLEPLKKGMLNKFAVDIINGMEYLHQMHYLHKTLAARNILIHKFGEYLNAQVSDYGISRVIDGQGGNYYKTEGVTLPIRWVPKECIPSEKSTGNFSFASDVWSFGVLLWECWTKGDIPYGAAKSNTEVRQLLLSGSSPLTFFRPQCPGDVMSVMESIFREKPEDRPTFTDLGKTFNRMKPQNQRPKKTPLGEQNEGSSQNGRQNQEKGNQKPRNPQQGLLGEAPQKQKGPKNPNKPQGPKFPQGNQQQNPHRDQHQNQPHRDHQKNQPRGDQHQNQPRQDRQQNQPHRDQQQQQRDPSSFGPGQGPPRGRRNKGPQQQQQRSQSHVGMDPPPPYSPPSSQGPFAAAAPPYTAQAPPPPYPSVNPEIEMQRKMMDLQQKINSLEVKQLEQKLQSLQNEVQKPKNKPRNPNQQQHHKKPPNQQNQNQPKPKNKGGQGPGPGNQNLNQGGPGPSIPDWVPAAGAAVFGLAAGAAIAAAAMNQNEKKKKK